MSLAFHTHFEQARAEVHPDLAPVTIVVADGLALVREGLAKLCADLRGCTVVAQCEDLVSAYREIVKWRPSIALLDLDLQLGNTLDLVRRLRDANPRTKVIVVSLRRDRKSAFEALRAGAAGFVLKSGSVDELSQAIEQIRIGGIYVTPLVNLQNRTIEEAGLPDAFETLSAREHQVFTMLVSGMRAKEIAARLALSPKTVDTYRSSLMRKLDIYDVAGLVKFAIARELTSISH